MSGIVIDRRPPKIIALMGTPAGSCQLGSIAGHCAPGAVKRPFGCEALAPVRRAISGVQQWPCQSRHSSGGFAVIPSHQTPPSAVKATLVNIVFFESAIIALGLVSHDVPGATPKKPVSGLMARKRPSSSARIHAISSPTVQVLHPSNPFGGMSMAKFVFP